MPTLPGWTDSRSAGRRDRSWPVGRARGRNDRRRRRYEPDRDVIHGVTARGARRPRMSNQRTHSVSTTDGVTIAGTVHGQGPPLVFVHGMMGDGDIDWQALLPRLTGRFTCHLPS